MRIYFDAVNHDLTECHLISLVTDGDETLVELGVRAFDTLELNGFNPDEYEIHLSHGFND